MAENVTLPRAEDVVSVGSRISWGAILAGAAVALAVEFLLMVLGGAAGVAIGDRADLSTIRTGFLIWTVVITCTAVFVGGMVTSQFTVGENKTEAILYGIIMWAVLIVCMLALASAGVRTTSNALVGLAQVASRVETSWESAARAAGVPSEEIIAWRQKLNANRERRVESENRATTVSSEAATRIVWFVFGGTWLSMFAAAAGAWFGAGPTFKLVPSNA